MKKRLVDKLISSTPSISEIYDREDRQFQQKYNHEHPGRHIWRHILHKRVFFFFTDKKWISVEVEIVRFIYAGTNKTMTFYGSMFLAYSSFSKQLQKCAVDAPKSICARTVCYRKIRKWRKGDKPHNPMYRTAPSDSS